MKNCKRILNILFYSFIVLLMISSCGEEPATNETTTGTTIPTVPTLPTDTAEPVVVSISPASGATGVGINSTISATFNKSVNSLDATKFIVNNGTSNISGTVSLSDKTVTFQPAADLTNSVEYIATVKAGIVEDTAGKASIADTVWKFTTQVQSAQQAQFTIKTSNIQKNQSTSGSSSSSTVKNVSVTLKSSTTEVSIRQSAATGASNCFKLSRNSDGSLRISGKAGVSANDCQLKVGDIIRIAADGYSTQEIIVNESMLDVNGTEIKLKEVGSIQTTKLGDLTNGVIFSKSRRGVHSVIEKSSDGEDTVHFKTDDGSLTLSMPVSRLARMARNLKRQGMATDDTTISLEMTTIDPKTEGDSAVGDFSFNPTFEKPGTTYNPSRATKTNRRVLTTEQREDYVLESVVMANIEMKANDTEIHCFSGDNTKFDETKQACTDEEEATLKMKVPTSQFEQFAKEYNLGQRKIPLYSYDTRNGQWVRQTKIVDGKTIEVDGELILEDNNQNKKADAGDVLYLEGKVGHFSYWNGDRPMERSCLEGTITRTGGESMPKGTQVIVEGVDYSGRKFTQRLSTTADSFNGLGVKKNAKAKVYLKYPDGSISEVVYVQSGSTAFTRTGTCQSKTEPGGTQGIHLTSNISTVEKTIIVKDTHNNVLTGAVVGTTYNTTITGPDGKATVVISKTKKTQLFVTYNTEVFEPSKTVEIDANDTSEQTVQLDIQSFKVTGKITFTDQAGKKTFPQGVVTIQYDGNFGYTEINSQGSYEISLPRSTVSATTNVSLNIYAYAQAFAKYLFKSKTGQFSTVLDSFDVSNNVGALNYDFVMKPFTVTGKVIDPAAATGQQGVSNISVWTSEGGYTMTDDNGFYKLTLFESDTNQLIYAWDNLMANFALPPGSSNQYITIDAGTNTNQADKNFRVSRQPAVLKGRVVNKKGVPPRGIQVYWSFGWEGAETDANGNFEIKTFYQGEGKIYIFNADWELLKESASHIPVRGKIHDFGELKIDTNLPYSGIIGMQSYSLLKLKSILFLFLA